MHTPSRLLIIGLALGLTAVGLTGCTAPDPNQTQAQACAILTDARDQAFERAQTIGSTAQSDPVGAGAEAVKLVFEATTAMGKISNSSVKPAATAFGDALSEAGSQISTLVSNPTSISLEKISAITTQVTVAGEAITKACS